MYKHWDSARSKVLVLLWVPPKAELQTRVWYRKPGEEPEGEKDRRKPVKVTVAPTRGEVR